MAEIGCSAFTVYCAIKAHADFHNGASIPAQETLCEQTGLSQRQIQRSIKLLQEHGLLVKRKEWKRNVYELREKILVDDAVATWTYLPATLKRARQELQNFLLTGDAKDAKIIHIEKLVIENLVVGDQINVSMSQPDLDAIKDPRLRTRLEAIFSSSVKLSRDNSAPDKNIRKRCLRKILKKDGFY